MRASWPCEYLLLGLLEQQPMHGYDLAQRLSNDDALRAIWRFKRSEVYFLLGKLAARGLVEELDDAQLTRFVVKRQESGPPRQIYQVTVEGRAALAAWIATPVDKPHDMRACFFAKLYLAMQRDSSVARTLVERQSQMLRGWQERLEPLAASASFPSLVYRLRLAQVEAALNVLDELNPTLEA
ncbi:MAG: PadR family transcriptional regulator [Anaerolineae bacterium]